MTAGAASISQTTSQPGAATAQTTTITQTSQNASLSWSSFNVGAKEAVNFVQPNASAIAVNRIHDTNGSQILGQLNANGQVYLINPNGVLFGQGAQVNVGGLVASTLEVSDASLSSSVRRFSGNGAGKVENQGHIRIAPGGSAVLLGNEVSNTGSIYAAMGTVALGAGNSAQLTFDSNRLVSLQIDQSLLNALAKNGGLIQADGGQVLLSAGAKDTLLGAVVNNTGIVEARTVDSVRGRIVLKGDVIVNTGSVNASATTGSVTGSGGEIAITARSVLQAGQVRADGADIGANGGQINIAASGALMQAAPGVVSASSAEGSGGNVRMTGGTSAVLSGSIQASGSGAQGQGGSVTLSAPQLNLLAAQVSADGAGQGGVIRVGGDAHGAPSDFANAQKTLVNASSTLSAMGQGGKVVVWADGDTHYSGSAKTGGNGFIEVSGKGTLHYSGQANAGAGGNVLLDPTNLVIGSAPVMTSFELANPTPDTNETHGTTVVALSTGNVVVTAPSDTAGGANAGAAYLYNGNTGALISTLMGKAGDLVGLNGVTALKGNGNYVVASQAWANGPELRAGAATWGSGTTGINGVVDASNSLVGSVQNESVGRVVALSNGNYVAVSPNVAVGGATFAGAVTWGSGVGGISGAITSSNSLVGSTAYDQIGSGGVTALSNGNYVVQSSHWSNGGNAESGAVTWGNGSSGITGAVSSSNSLVGSAAGDRVGYSGVLELANGHYVVRSSLWANGGQVEAGAVTWGNGTTGVSGAVSASNSLVGSTEYDRVGLYGVMPLNNGNFVVRNPFWNSATAFDVGAVTLGKGDGTTVGAVTDTNSLVGSQFGDVVGLGMVATIGNDNYVVHSPNWSNGSVAQVGAVTWGSGTLGVTGAVSASNSLVGAQAGDRVGSGGVTALSNGNYVAISPEWAHGSVANAGAVTWGNGSTGTVGTVSASNSLVGSTAGDRVGIGGVTALSNGHYVVQSYYWTNNGNANAGAVTWGNGTTGTAGPVSAGNSLVGTQADDWVGDGGVTALSNGNYVVVSPSWANGSASQAGAVTWANGATGLSGAVSASNSLVGSETYDGVGSSGVVKLANGNYVVISDAWNTQGYGAVTWGSGTAGVSGPVSGSNSLVGSQNSDYVGVSGVVPLSNGNYLVRSELWANGGLASAGAVTWGNGNGGTTGSINTSNSVVGTSANGYLGGAGVSELSGNRFLVTLPNATQGSFSNAGRVLVVEPPQSSPTSVANANSAGGSVTVTPASLAAASAAGSTITLTASNDITVDQAVSLSGKLVLNAGNDLTLNAGLASTDTGTALTLVAGHAFINNAGANALSTPNGTWQVWSANASNDTTGGLVNQFTQHNATFGSTAVAAGASGNGFLYRASAQGAEPPAPPPAPAPAPAPAPVPARTRLAASELAPSPAPIFASSDIPAQTLVGAQIVGQRGSTSSRQLMSSLTLPSADAAVSPLALQGLGVNVINGGVKLPPTQALFTSPAISE